MLPNFQCATHGQNEVVPWVTNNNEKISLQALESVAQHLEPLNTICGFLVLWLLCTFNAILLSDSIQTNPKSASKQRLNYAPNRLHFLVGPSGRSRFGSLASHNPWRFNLNCISAALDPFPREPPPRRRRSRRRAAGRKPELFFASNASRPVPSLPQ